MKILDGCCYGSKDFSCFIVETTSTWLMPFGKMLLITFQTSDVSGSMDEVCGRLLKEAKRCCLLIEARASCISDRRLVWFSSNGVPGIWLI